MLHLQIGASKGLSAVRAAVPAWTELFRRAPVRLLPPFLRSLATPPTGSSEALAIFAPEALGAVGRAVLDAVAGDGRQLALPLLCDLCDALEPQV